jgi:CRISPR-associated protein Cpf1
MVADGILEADEARSNDYLKAKEIIDGYHRHFIETTLSKASFDWSKLAEGYDSIRNKTDDLASAKVVAEETRLMLDISKAFTKEPVFAKMSKKEMFSEILPAFYKNDNEKLTVVKSFNKFTSYFTGFNENRMNVYSEEDISTSVGHRLVSDNFPKFYGNIQAYQRLKLIIPDQLAELETTFSKDQRPISLDRVFSIDGFNDVLTGKGIELYNSVIGGYTKSDGTKVQGINEYVNLYGQQNDVQRNFKNTHSMVTLYKQILNDRVSNLFVLNGFEKDQDVIEELTELHNKYDNEYKVSICAFLSQCADNNAIRITIPGINEMSQSFYGDYGAIKNELNEEFTTANIKKGKLPKTKEEYLEKKKDWCLSEIRKAAKVIDSEREVESDPTGFIVAADQRNAVEATWKSCEPLLSKAGGKSLIQDDAIVSAIKAYLEACLDLNSVIRTIVLDSESGNIQELIAQKTDIDLFMRSVIDVYNKTRNYVTKKPYSQDKIKLNFSNPVLASGWSVTKEKDDSAIILLRDNKYYLGIMNVRNKPDIYEELNCKDGYRKMVYEYAPNVNKMIPKCAMVTEVKKHFSEGSKTDYVLDDPKKFSAPLTVTSEIYQIYSDPKQKYKKQYLTETGDKAGYLDALHKWIAFCIDFSGKYLTWKNFDFSAVKSAKEYESLDRFYNDLDNCCYRISFIDVSQKQIDQCIEEDQLYLFQIYSKDFADGAKGRKNLHTMYFEACFSEYNQKARVFRLSGGAELFWRKPSIAAKVTHREGDILINRIDKDGRTIPSEIYKELVNHYNHNAKLSDKAKEYADQAVTKKARFDITKDRRYTQEQFSIHVPVAINYTAGKVNRINDSVNGYLRNNPDVKIIGVDRGERNLLYVCMIDQSGRILKQKSYNIVEETRFNGETRAVDYLDKLELREKERNEARQSWKTIGNIKELKEGYLSMVVHEITDMMVENNAVLVMENLNRGFKRGRMKFERQVYQKFEMMLINKLNFLCDKTSAEDNSGSIYHAYQLTAKVADYQDIYQQTGFIYYVVPSYTSKIDPTTGFADIFNHSDAKNDKEGFLDKMTSIKFDSGSDMFQFVFDYDQFNLRDTMPITKWTAYTNGNRLIHQIKNGQHSFVTLDITKYLQDYLIENHIDFKNGSNLITELNAIEDKRKHAAVRDALFNTFFWALQMRNSSSETGEDYIISPVKNSTGDFYCSSDRNESLPIDADANGAYNIARKGLMIKQRIDASKADEKVNLNISNTEWFEFASKK